METPVISGYAQRNNNVTKLNPAFSYTLPDFSGGENPFGGGENPFGGGENPFGGGETPFGGGENPFGVSIAITGAPVYTLTLPNVYVDGIYTVDLLNLSSGTFDAGGREINIILFSISVPINFVSAPCNPVVCPDQEFTIFFKNLPAANSVSPIFTIGIIANDFVLGGPPPFPYIFSPLLPVLLTENVSQSVTFKRDGLSVVSSGPAEWVGLVSLYETMLSLPPVTSP